MNNPLLNDLEFKKGIIEKEKLDKELIKKLNEMKKNKNN